MDKKHSAHHGRIYWRRSFPSGTKTLRSNCRYQIASYMYWSCSSRGGTRAMAEVAGRTGRSRRDSSWWWHCSREPQRSTPTGERTKSTSDTQLKSVWNTTFSHKIEAKLVKTPHPTIFFSSNYCHSIFFPTCSDLTAQCENQYNQKYANIPPYCLYTMF